MVTAVVRVWHAEDGWGVLDCEETPGGCWAHYSVVQMDGYRALASGQQVCLDWEYAEQDGFRFRAVQVLLTD